MGKHAGILRGQHKVTEKAAQRTPLTSKSNPRVHEVWDLVSIWHPGLDRKVIRNLSRPDPRPENGIPQGQVFTGPWSTLPWGKECQPSREGSSSGRQQRYNSLPRRPTGLLLLCSLWVTGKGLSTDGVTIFYLPISQPIPRPGVSLPSSHCPVDKQINKQKKNPLSSTLHVISNFKTKYHDSNQDTHNFSVCFFKS